MLSLKVLFGKRLRQLRDEKGITQEQLGEAAGLTPQQVSAIERGKHGPQFDHLEKMAQKLQEPVWQLFYFEPGDP